MRVQIADMDLEQIHLSGQCFRWERLGEGRYRIPAFGRSLVAEQRDGFFEFSCSAREFDEVWRFYFDLDRDYGAIKRQIDPKDLYLNKAAAFGGGVRVLRQELWEVVFSFIISQNNHIPRIRQNINTLCAWFGGGLPSPAALACEKPETLRKLGLGYRAEYLCAAGGFFSDASYLSALKELPYPQSKEALQRIKGIGPKVADCICLFGLHQVEGFPLDTHIKRILREEYPKGFPFKRYQGYAGILQQYMFYYDLFGKKEPR